MNSQFRICFSIPASPTEGFYSQIAMLRFVLDKLGGIYKSADIILSLGAETQEKIPERWLLHMGVRTKLNWADTQLFKKIGQMAQGNNRWRSDYKEYDVVVFIDADTMLLKPLEEIFMPVKSDHLISGVIAHYPFPHDKQDSPSELWHYLAKRYIDKDISLDYRYSLLENNSYKADSYCPFYINFGFVVMTPHTLIAIRDSYLDIRSKIIPVVKDARFSGQIALALAIHKHNAPVMSLPMRYNFPNDPLADKLYPDELKSISVLHYLRTDKFNRQKIFISEENFLKFLSLRLHGSNKVFQDYIRNVTNGRYPFK